MAADTTTATYPALVGFIYIFNICVGTGALALPRAFQDAGYILGVIILTISCFISYISATFIVESMAAANAVIQGRKLDGEISSKPWNTQENDKNESVRQRRSTSRSTVSIPSRKDFFEIRERVELSEMASIFVGRYGVILFYVCLIIYLYGDLAIYGALVPKSLTTIICAANASCPLTSDNRTGQPSLDDPCFADAPAWLTRFTVYRLLVCLFVIIIGPFVFFGVTSTKYLQMVTTTTRWIALILMIVLGIRRIALGQGHGTPKAADFSKFGSIFGITVYSFMCQHSLPAVVTPMKTKSKFHFFILLIFILILIFYATLAVSGSFAFVTLEDVYTLNFFGPCGPKRDRAEGDTALLVFDYFLAFFPVFTLSASWPVFGITLRNNMRALFFGTSSIAVDSKAEISSRSGSFRDDPDQQVDKAGLCFAIGSDRTRRLLSTYLVPILVIIPPWIISLCTDNVELLSSITGSYPGVGVQFVLPALLVMGVRKNVPIWLDWHDKLPHGSPFSGIGWPIFLFVWSLLTVIIVTVNFAMR